MSDNQEQRLLENYFLISPEIPQQRLPENTTLKLGILASGSGSNFEAIAAGIKTGKLNAKIQVLIYNNPGAKVIARAENFGVPAILLNHRNYKNQREDFDREIIKTLRAYDVEWVIMAGWMRIATPVLVSAFPNHIINIHPSLLPSFPGIKAVEQALAARVKITGCTVHLVSEEVDSGPILMQALDSEEVVVQQAAIAALGEIGAVEAIDSILRFAQSEDWLIRQRLAEALGNLPSPKSISALKYLEKDSHPQVSQAATLALKQVMGNG